MRRVSGTGGDRAGVYPAPDRTPPARDGDAQYPGRTLRRSERRALGQSVGYQPPAASCPLCPRLVLYREQNRATNPGWFNGAVPSFGELDARFLVVGLAPGVRGANR